MKHGLTPALALAALVLAATSSCSGPTAKPDNPGEEAQATEQEVPRVVREKGAEITRRLGPSVRCSEWLWDAEDSCWECAVSGLSRSAELDVTPEGQFSELELVLGFREIQEATPPVADMLVAACQDPLRTVAELSLRSEGLVSAEPRLGSVWGRDGVFMEIRCPDGGDFEVDPFGAVVTPPDDDGGRE